MTGVLLDRSPLLLEQLELASGERCGWRVHLDGESFLYVVAGAGTLELPGDARPLAPESVVWLERGDRFRLAAGEAALTVLVATVEGGKAE